MYELSYYGKKLVTKRKAIKIQNKKTRLTQKLALLCDVGTAVVVILLRHFLESGVLRGLTPLALSTLKSDSFITASAT